MDKSASTELQGGNGANCSSRNCVRIGIAKAWEIGNAVLQVTTSKHLISCIDDPALLALPLGKSNCKAPW